MKFTEQNIKKWIVPALVFLALILLSAGVYRCNRLSEELRDAKRNIVALNDTVHEVEMRNGELVEWSNSLVVDKNTLEVALEDENISKRELEKNLNSKITQLSRIISEFHSDTITMTDTILVMPDSTVAAPFSYRDDWLTVSGKTLFRLDNLCSETTITGISVRVPITIGLTDDYQVFAHTTNPNASIELLNSLSLEPKDYRQKRFGFGMYGGFGFTYGLVSRRVDLGPQFGVGFYWRIF